MIRLPIGSRTRMVIAVTDIDGTVLGLASHAGCDLLQHRRGRGQGAQHGVLQRPAAAPRICREFPLAPPSPTGRLVSERSRSFRRASTVPDRGPFFDLYVQDTDESLHAGIAAG